MIVTIVHRASYRVCRLSILSLPRRCRTRARPSADRRRRRWRLFCTRRRRRDRRRTRRGRRPSPRTAPPTVRRLVQSNSYYSRHVSRIFTVKIENNTASGQGRIWQSYKRRSQILVRYLVVGLVGFTLSGVLFGKKCGAHHLEKKLATFF